MKMKGSRMVVECLKREGIKVMFGITGGAILPVYDALYDEAELNCILVRHEQAAAHAADGYAKATGKVGVCIATSGPGATNLVTGIATAFMDSIPIVAITGQVATHLIGNDAFQEADVTGITRPITKHNYLVKSIHDLPRILKEAFYIARSGRPGPVLVDIAKDVQNAEAEFEYPETVSVRSYKPTVYGHSRQINKAVELIHSAKKPVLYSGGGTLLSGASDELRELALKANIPTTTTVMGLGAFDETHPLSLKMLGMHGSRYANHAVQESDLLVAVGARFDDRVTGRLDKFAPQAKIIHIDIDPAAISKNVKVDVPIVGDVKHVLREMNKYVHRADTEAWLRQIEVWKEKYPLWYKQTGKIKPQFVIDQMYQMSKGLSPIFVADVGQHQMWGAQFINFTKPNTYLNSGGLGTMGYALPAAIGAQFGCPDRLVFVLAGDGGYQMNIQELTTIMAYKLPIKVCVINNFYHGMVRQWQEILYNKRYSGASLLPNPDFAKVAEAFGIMGIRVEEADEVAPALTKALNHPGPAVIDFIVDECENVWPMVPSGAALDEMIGEDEYAGDEIGGLA